MKKIYLTIATICLLVALGTAVKPDGERQGDSPNTGVFGQCGNDEQCNDGLFCNGVEWCDKSTSPGHCEAGEPACDEDCDEETDTCIDICTPDGAACTSSEECCNGCCDVDYYICYDEPWCPGCYCM